MKCLSLSATQHCDERNTFITRDTFFMCTMSEKIKPFIEWSLLRMPTVVVHIIDSLQYIE